MVTNTVQLPGAGLRCGLLGKVLGHSYSPQIHGNLCAYSYDLFEVPEEKLEDFLLHGDFNGINVTIPYKKAVFPYCAELSEAARAIGSVNTLVRRADNTLYGDNTDWIGFLRTVERSGIDVTGKKVLILGTGGASVAVRYVLEKLQAEIVMISRSGPDNYENLDRHADASIIVNTTPVGMYPNNGKAALSLEHFPRLEAVFDLIYNPARTALMLDAEKRGIPAYNGLYMLVSQAVASAASFIGQPIDSSRTDEVYAILRRQMENIILIGMPGSGKTTIGSVLAEMTGKKLIDADAALVARVGIDIPTIFSEQGEASFRREETETLRELGKQSGVILATGGGCVTREENYDLLHQNGTIICLKRPLDTLAIDGRPLSQNKGVEVLYQQRKPLYEAFADYMISNTRTPEETAREITELL